MTCQTTISNKHQSEFEYFQQMASRPDSSQCCGPLTMLAFSSESLIMLHEGLTAAGVSSVDIDNFTSSMLDSSHLGYLLCAKHWMELVKKLGKVSLGNTNDNWIQLSFYIFRVLCLTNDWDYKEIMNYTKTLNTID